MLYYCILHSFKYIGVPTRFPWHHIMLISRNSNTTAAISRAGTAKSSVAPQFTPWITMISILFFFFFFFFAWSEVFCGVVFCRSLFVLLSFSFGYCVVYSSSDYPFCYLHNLVCISYEVICTNKRRIRRMKWCFLKGRYLFLFQN